jgi:O-6-methylguanine DNA methyltransferase
MPIRGKGPAHRKRTVVTVDAVTHVFPSELGWMAMVMVGPALRELTFGHASPAAALSALKSAPDQPRTSDGAKPTKEQARLIRRLRDFARGAKVDFSDVRLDSLPAATFTRSVVEHCRRIPFGGTLTYGQLAALAGSPRAARAVGNIMRTNRFAPVVPCHRVVPGNGQSGAYSAGEGARTKLRLLEQEALAARR